MSRRRAFSIVPTPRRGGRKFYVRRRSFWHPRRILRFWPSPFMRRLHHRENYAAGLLRLSMLLRWCREWNCPLRRSHVYVSHIISSLLPRLFFTLCYIYYLFVLLFVASYFVINLKKFYYYFFFDTEARITNHY